MNVGIVVGKKYRHLRSVARYVERLSGKSTVTLLNPLASSGDVIAFHAAERTGKHVLFVTPDGNTPADRANGRVDFVKQVDRVVVFNDRQSGSSGSKKIDHIINLANVNKKELVEFKEV